MRRQNDTTTNDMFEHKKTLDRIEKLIDQLPYRAVRIEIEFPKETLVLQKDKQNKIGFTDKG